VKPREIFVLAVRILGVWALLGAIDGLVTGLIAVGMKVFPVPLFPALAQIIAGVYCLRGGPHLVAIAFPPAANIDSKST
jgi:hypothetical protein